MLKSKSKKIFIALCLSLVLLMQFTSMTALAVHGRPPLYNDGGGGGSKKGGGGGGARRDPPTQHLQ